MPVCSRDHKKSRAEYVETKWQVRVNESTITQILQRSNQLLSEKEIIAPNAKKHRSVTYPELEQVLKEFVLMRQHQTVLSDAILIERAKTLASGLGIPEGALNFSVGWLQKFKIRNSIHQIKLQGEGASVNLLSRPCHSCMKYALIILPNVFITWTRLVFSIGKYSNYAIKYLMSESHTKFTL